MRKRIWISLIRFALSVLLCTVALLSSGFADEPKYGGTLRIGARIPQYDRLDVRYPLTPSMVPTFEWIYDRLFNWGKESFDNLVPGLATKYETKDAKVWTIHLRKGVKFHNGREMTAEDVKVNFDWRIRTPKGWQPVIYKEYIRYLNRVEVLDKYTIRIVLDQPFSSLMPILAYAVRGISPPEEVEKWQDKFSFHPCGTGPFKVVEIKPPDRIVLERFDGYWGPRPYVDRIEMKYIRSEEARLVALQNGEIDIAQLYDEAKPIIEKDTNLKYEEVVHSATLNKLYFNMRRWPMNDIRFRKAMWMGADWKNISINAFPFKSGNFPRTLLDRTKYFNSEALKLVPPYNPEEAKKLIQQVEKDSGKKIPPIYYLQSSSGPNTAAAEMAKIQLAQVGINLDLHLMSHAIWSDKLARDPKMEWDVGGIGYGFSQDPHLGFDAFVTNSGTAPDGKSLGAYSNPEFDKWIVKAEQATSEEDRKKCFQEAEKILLRDVTCIPAFYLRLLIAWNKKLKGVVTHPDGSIYVSNQWVNIGLEK